METPHAEAILILFCITNCKIHLNVSSSLLSTYSVNHSKVHTFKLHVLTSPLQLSSLNLCKSSIGHEIHTEDNATLNFKPRLIAAAKLEAAKNKFQFLLYVCVIQRSQSPRASPLHLVPIKET